MDLRTLRSRPQEKRGRIRSHDTDSPSSFYPHSERMEGDAILGTSHSEMDHSRFRGNQPRTISTSLFRCFSSNSRANLFRVFFVKPPQNRHPERSALTD
jgi:hypothetical protein